MNEERRARIVELETEAQKLRVAEADERRAHLKSQVDAMFAGYSYSDACIVRDLVNAHCQRLHAIEHDDE